MTNVLMLPGIIAPVAVRYADLLLHLRDVDVVLKDLAIYEHDEPPAGYSIDHEVRAIERAANDAGWSRFHLYAHSGGAACALAFAAKHPDRLASLSIDEPACDFTDEDFSDPVWGELDAADRAPDPLTAFLRLQLAPGVPLPPRPDGPPPPWMTKRALGVRTFAAALRRHHVDPAAYRAFAAPVLYTLGSLSHPHWRRIRDRLASLFPRFEAVEFLGLHHLQTSHQAEPVRTASLLRQHWASAA